MAFRKKNIYLNLVNSYIIDSPQPSSISYLWNFGSLLGLMLVIQLATGITLAMHYTPNVDLAFYSVEHIMRDVNYGWLIRYIHANGASFFFIFVYLHMARGLYYGSFKQPRGLLWSIGVIIFLVMIITAFLGYKHSPRSNYYKKRYEPSTLWCLGNNSITNNETCKIWINKSFVRKFSSKAKALHGSDI